MGAADAANKYIKNQIEKIIDEGSGSHRSVIVQMRPENDWNERLLSVTAEVHRRRSLVVSARDLLPAARTDLEKLGGGASRKRSAGEKRILENSFASLSVQLAAAVLPFIGAAFLKEVGLSALLPLFQSEIVKKTIADSLAVIEKKSSAQAAPPSPPKFWSSSSMVLNLTTKALARLPEEVTTIQEILPNRTFRLPRPVSITNVPPEVQDEKTASWGLKRIGALSAWGAYDARGKGVKVAVLDTGVDPQHPALKGRVKDWAEFDTDGFEVINSQPHDPAEHGTHCAGIIAGGNTDGSWIGVAPEADLAIAKVMKDGHYSDAQILAATQWAIDRGVDVINMSIGALSLDVEAPDPHTYALVSAMTAGILVVTAIGNDGAQTTGTPGNDWFAFSVGATDFRDRTAGFSGGRTHVVRKSEYVPKDYLPLVYSKPEVTAPGVAVRSAIPGNKFAAFSGTSMATPHVAGAVALLLSATNIKEFPESQRALLLQDLLTGSVEELGESGQDHRYGFGRIDVLRAIGFAKERGY